MTLAIDVLRRAEVGGAAAVQAFLDEHTFPMVEGGSVTFVYRGAADAVRLRHWIYGLPSSMPLQRVAGSDLWALVIELPHGSRLEYKLEIEAAGQRTLIMDPLNPLVSHAPTGSNSVCHAAGYETPEWIARDDEARAGELEEVSISDGRAERRVTVYLPARFRRNRRYPLLVVHDGEDYLGYASLKTVLDNLIHRLEIPAMVVAATQSPDRLKEYADDPSHARFVVERLVPQLERRYPLREEPQSRGLMGASFGAVASLSAAWRYPGRFGRLLLQSGSFAFTDIGEQRRGPVFDPVVKFVNAFRAEPGKPADRIFMSCGMYESLIYENRSMVPLLQSAGMEIRYAESRDGHNWESWRDRMREGLSWLFPGPLWLVYE